MAKKKTNSKPKPVDRSTEVIKLDKLVETLGSYDVAKLQLDKSLEECRQLNDQFELVKVEALEVDSPSVYTQYGSFFRRIKAIERKLEEQRVKEKEPHLQGGRVVDAKFKGFAAFAVRIRKLFDGCMTTWDKEQERLRREEESRLREKARKEQEKLDKRAAKKAEKLEAAGKAEEADAVREAVPVVPTPTVEQTNIPKVAGITKTKRWGAEITDEAIEKQSKLLIDVIKQWNALPQAKDKQLISGEYWTLDIKKLGAMARALKGKLELPDVKVIDDDSRH